MKRIDAVEMALAATLVLTGCSNSNKDNSKNPYTDSLVRTSAPRYIPAEQLPIKRDNPFFIRYQGTNPPLEHLLYLEKVCGRLGISMQDPELVIGTSQTEDCVGKIAAQRP